MKQFFSLLIICVIIISGCSPEITGKIVKKGYINCFEEGLKKQNGKPVYCEASGVLFSNNKLILVNDKAIPGKSPIFSVNYPQFSNVEYYRSDVIKSAMKYEDITATLDNKYIIASTAFDRVKKDSHKWDIYNNIVYWKKSSPETAKIVSASTQDNITSSINLRPKIASALDNIPYFKIEGLTVVPGNKILFGVREVGEKYNDFNFVIKIISVTFGFKDEEIVFNDNFKFEYEFDLSKYKNRDIKALNLGLSSLVYHKEENCLYLLTSYEKKEAVGGVLWKLPIDDLREKKQPDLIEYEDGSTLFFEHKAEGITLLNKDKLFIIHDDDKLSTGKKPNQAAYTIVEIE